MAGLRWIGLSLLSLAAAMTLVAAKPAVASAPCTLRVLDVPPNDYRYSYYLRLLQLILTRTEPAYGPCQLLKRTPVSHSRKFHMMKNHQLDIIWNVTTKALEADLLPVRMPVHFGLHGFRLLLIRAGEEARFQDVTSVAALKNFVAGLVNDWQLADVLQANGLPMEKTGNYDNLYPMLKRHRFDYIPLDFVEALHEMDRHQGQVAMVVEPRLLLHYDSMDFFFVSPDNPALAKRLSDGFAMVTADGSRNDLFDRFFTFDEVLKRAQVGWRRILELHNPDAPGDMAEDSRNAVFSVEGLIKREKAAALASP